MAEFPELGKRCNVDKCQQLDFLPFECASCHKIYCLDHRSVDAHSCTQAAFNQKIVISEKTNYDHEGPVCDLVGCNKSIATTCVICDGCNGQFCLLHRHLFDHHCISLVNEQSSSIPQAPVVSKAAQYVEEIKKDIKGSLPTSSSIKNKAISEKNAAIAAKIALMKLKQTALGDHGKIPEEERIYLRLTLPPGSTWRNSPDIPIFFSKTWSIGKCIDTAAKLANLSNDNNRIDKKKLRLILSNGHVCEMDKYLKELEDSRDIINGGNAALIYE